VGDDLSGDYLRGCYWSGENIPAFPDHFFWPSLVLCRAASVHELVSPQRGDGGTLALSSLDWVFPAPGHEYYSGTTSESGRTEVLHYEQSERHGILPYDRSGRTEVLHYEQAISGGDNKFPDRDTSLIDSYSFFI